MAVYDIYRKPQTLVSQAYVDPTLVSPVAQKAYFIGGDAQLVKYGTATEEDGDIGRYTGTTQFFTWPNRQSVGNSNMDSAYTKLYVKRGLFQYWTGASPVVEVITGSYNTIKSDTLTFASNGSLYPRSAVFGNRDVQVGDALIMTAYHNTLNRSVTLHTFVEALIAEGSPSFIDPVVEPGGANQATISAASATVTKPTSYSNVTATASATTYNGQVDGAVEDTYIIQVLTGSTAADATTARLRVTTVSGKDQQDSIAPAAFGSPTAIGTRGLTVTFTAAGSGFAVGDKWLVSVKQKFTATTAVAGGTYDSQRTTSYVVTVTRGGAYGSSTMIRSQTLEGDDVRTNIPVTAAGTPVQISDTGLAITFNGADGLCTNDTFTIMVTGIDPTAGKKNMILMRNNLPANFISTTGDITISDMRLCLIKDTEIPEYSGSAVNWTQSEDGIDVSGSISIASTDFVRNGAMIPLPLVSFDEYSSNCILYLEYRNWLGDYSDDIYSVNSVTELNMLLPGMIDPDNPLKYALYMGLLNHGDVALLFTSVASPDLVTDWSHALEVTSRSVEAYNLVPLTYNKEVQGMFYRHALDYSVPQRGLERCVWLGIALNDTSAIVDYVGNMPVTAIVTKDTSTSQQRYNEMVFTTAGVDLINSGVRAGDAVRYQYRVDTTGGYAYNTYTVATVVNANTLRLTTALPGPVSTAQKVEIWRTMSSEDVVNTVNEQTTYSSERVRWIFPDKVMVGEQEVNSFTLAGMLASLSSSVTPQQGLTHYPIDGITDVMRTKQLSDIQLNNIAYHGTWIVTQDLSGVAFTRHAVTGAAYEQLMEREEMIVRNRDSIVKFIRSKMDGYIGITNITPTSIGNMRAAIRSALIELQGRNATEVLGGQVLDFGDIMVWQDPVFKDTVNVTIEVVIPTPTNELRIRVTFVHELT